MASANGRKSKYTFIDLFAGCGGLSEGFLLSGKYEALAHVEWEYPMVETLRSRLEQSWKHSKTDAEKRVILFDIQKTDELLNGQWNEESKVKYAKYNHPDIVEKGLKGLIKNRSVDLIIGGPPCQAYSIHGRATDKNSMKQDYRNYLFESFVQVVNAFKPRAFIFENVTGMLSAKPGGEFVVNRIYKAFQEIGYKTLEPAFLKNAVFNAYDYNVPQNRERVILIGIRDGENFSLDDFYECMKKNKSEKKLSVKDAIGNLPKIFPLPIIKKVGGKNLSHSDFGITDNHHKPRHCSARDINTIREWIGNNMNYCSQKEAIAFYKKVTGKDTLYRKYRNLEWDKPSPTVVAHLQKDGFMFIHPDINQSRFITVREAALLMTFPMDYEFKGSRAFCYKMIGNAVPVNFAKAIAQSVYKVLK